MIKFKQIGLVAAVAAMFAVQPAMADSLNFDWLYYSGADTVHIVNTPSVTEPGVAEYVYSAGFKMEDQTGAWTMGGVTTAKNASFLAWCIDIFADMGSANYTLMSGPNYGPISGNSIVNNTLNSTKVLELERLASNDLSLVTNAKTSSAFQLAAWEIMAETGSTLNVSNGSFSVYGDALGADKLANTWLGNLGTAKPTMNLFIWSANKPGSTQDLAVFAPAPATPVPEPESYAMLLAGLGLMGFMVRRKKSA